MAAREDSVDVRRRRRRAARPSAPWRPGASPQLETMPGRVLTITDRCWQCRSKVRGIVGVLVAPGHTRDGTGFLPFDVVAEDLAATLDRRTLAGRRIGQLRHRDSPGVPGGYLSNGCIECDALIGRFRLEDLLHEHLTNGGTYSQLDIGIRVELPLAPPVRLRALG